MKKLLLLFTGVALLNTAQAQVPKEENIGVFGKLTANWCPPCGGWGWALNEDVLTTNQSIATGLSMYADLSTSQNNGKFQNQAAYDFKALITLTGWPSYSVNFVDISAANTSGGSVNTAGIKTDANADLLAFNLAPVEASTGMTFRIHNDSVTVVTKTKFWKAASGTYKVAVYLVEDGALATQAGQTGTVEHHNVLRTSMTPSTWGVQIATGTIAKDAEYDETFVFDLNSSISPSYADQPSTWDKSKLVPFAVIYKVSGISSHEYVNGTTAYGYAASVGDISTVQNMTIYPNPATSMATVSFEAKNATDVTVNVIDNIGRTVYSSGVINAGTGRTFHNINTENFASGIYNVNITSDNGTSTERLSIVK